MRGALIVLIIELIDYWLDKFTLCLYFYQNP